MINISAVVVFILRKKLFRRRDLSTMALALSLLKKDIWLPLTLSTVMHAFLKELQNYKQKLFLYPPQN